MGAGFDAGVALNAAIRIPDDPGGFLPQSAGGTAGDAGAAMDAGLVVPVDRPGQDGNAHVLVSRELERLFDLQQVSSRNVLRFLGDNI